MICMKTRIIPVLFLQDIYFSIVCNIVRVMTFLNNYFIFCNTVIVYIYMYILQHFNEIVTKI